MRVRTAHHLLDSGRGSHPSSETEKEIAVSRNKAFIALPVAIVLGILQSSSAALASAGDGAQGGFDTLGSNGQSVESPRAPMQSYVGNSGKASYGFVGSPSHHAAHVLTRRYDRDQH